MPEAIKFMSHNTATVQRAMKFKETLENCTKSRLCKLILREQLWIYAEVLSRYDFTCERVDWDTCLLTVKLK